MSQLNTSNVTHSIDDWTDMCKPSKVPGSAVDLFVNNSHHDALLNQESSEQRQSSHTRLLASYLYEVLGLESPESENTLDQQTQARAAALGLSLTFDGLGSGEESNGVSSVPTTSPSQSSRCSLGSAASYSTYSSGFLSYISDISHRRRHSPPSNPLSTKFLSKVSSTFRHHNNSSGTPVREETTSSSPLPQSASTISLTLIPPSSVQRRRFRRIKALGILGSYHDSSQSLLPDVPSQTTPATSSNHNHGSRHSAYLDIAKADGARYPESHQNTVMDVHIEHDRTGTARFLSGRYPACELTAVMTLVQPKVIEFSGMRELRDEQEEQNRRFTAWRQSQRHRLDERYFDAQTELRQKHAQALRALIDEQEHSMAEAEDKQVQGEADLHLAHAKERRDNDTALKHQLAFCSGVYSTGEPHGRLITEQDRAELERTQRERDHMDARHANAVNVLRGEQTRRIQLRAARHEKEMHDLKRRQDKEYVSVERRHAEEVRELEELVRECDCRLRRRWCLETGIFLKTLEKNS